ncbi:Protein indeterminate-domain 2 [Ananas comosus]|uniref:Protein indeterminate-domain 2 n=1 Tax=Ananas comosus TaxID=4615 RepID=A0A199W1F2_ANACO|nr:Protein indeterminate-domain 2 [Ananas comosus]
MMKGLIIQQQQQQQHQQLLVEENMSNLTSASNEASVSSNQQSSFASPNPNPAKKKRNLPGNPDPDAEVIALSPKTLMATNRFVCEICNKGFQRDQNLQLHRRGHNLPWKLKQRSSKEVRKKVYICPEVTCVHHDPSRALGDLTGIKKHFSRKHGEKKWKCDKCSKKYAVQSDWKAHSKICGTREYRCDCGTLFSRAITANNNPLAPHHPLLFSQPSSSQDPSPLSPTTLQAQFPQFIRSSETNTNISNSNHGLLQELSLKREQQQQQFSMRQDHVPSWLSCQGSTPLNPLELPSSIFSARLEQQHEYTNENSAPNVNIPAFSTPYQASAASPHMSATALLQKAAQMGATLSRSTLQGQMASHTSNNTAANSLASSSGFGLGLSSQQEMGGNSSSSDHGFKLGTASPLLSDMMMNNPLSTFEDPFGGMMGSKREGNVNSEMETIARMYGRKEEGGSGVGVGVGWCGGAMVVVEVVEVMG